MIWTDLWGWELEPEDNGQITVRCGCFVRIVEVEEFHAYEPSAYVWDEGWTCFDGAGVEFYVSTSGNVWLEPENKEVGMIYAPNARKVEYMPDMCEM